MSGENKTETYEKHRNKIIAFIEAKKPNFFNVNKTNFFLVFLELKGVKYGNRKAIKLYNL